MPSPFSGGEGTNKLLSIGATSLNSIFGQKTDSIANLIANESGISKTSSSSLLKVLMPIIYDVLWKMVKSEGITNAAGLASFLSSQNALLKTLLPAGFSSILGIANLSELGKKTSVTAQLTEEKSVGSGGYLPWLLLFLLLAFAWILFKNYIRLTTPPPEVSVPQVSAPDNSISQIAEPVVYTVGDFFEKTLSTGFAIKAAKDGIENKLIAFIEDTGRAVDKKTWFTMDGITFDTGKATLTPQSTAQVTNIAEILKAFPNVKIKIGGYTDSTGDLKTNLTLSGDRAKTVENALADMGINALRLDSEGYGSEYPVATNETEEGRQQNRRIDILVIAK